MHDSYIKGEIAQLKVQLRAAELGYFVSRPTVEGRYDCIVDDGEAWHRAQVKYADHRHPSTENAVNLDLRKQCRNQGSKRSYSKNEIDVLLVYCPETDKVYRFGPEVFHDRNLLTLRFEKAKNRQTKGVIMAKDFEW